MKEGGSVVVTAKAAEAAMGTARYRRGVVVWPSRKGGIRRRRFARSSGGSLIDFGYLCVDSGEQLEPFLLGKRKRALPQVLAHRLVLR